MDLIIPTCVNSYIDCINRSESELCFGTFFFIILFFFYIPYEISLSVLTMIICGSICVWIFFLVILNWVYDIDNAWLIDYQYVWIHRNDSKNNGVPSWFFITLEIAFPKSKYPQQWNWTIYGAITNWLTSLTLKLYTLTH